MGIGSNFPGKSRSNVIKKLAFDINDVVACKASAAYNLLSKICFLLEIMANWVTGIN
ncbi:MAG: hypothetical protein ACFFC7_09715 [Candidatus Hermodarchaeota archaeon]